MKDINLISGFSGWADAGYISSYCLNYLIRKLKAEKFAEIVSDEFYVLSNISKRPKVLVENAYLEDFNYPTFEFYSWNDEKGENFTFSFGPEPDMKWDNFLDLLSTIIQKLNIKRIYSIGGVVSNERRIFAVVNKQYIKRELEKYDISFIAYKGPSSIHSAMLSYFKMKNIEAVSLWGSTPFAHREDPRSWYVMLEKIKEILGIDVDIEDLKKLAEGFEKEIGEEKENRKDYEHPYWM